MVGRGDEAYLRVRGEAGEEGLRRGSAEGRGVDGVYEEGYVFGFVGLEQRAEGVEHVGDLGAEFGGLAFDGGCESVEDVADCGVVDIAVYYYDFVALMVCLRFVDVFGESCEEFSFGAKSVDTDIEIMAKFELPLIERSGV